MSAELASESAARGTEVARPWRARLVLALGPAVACGGVVWAVVQPWRITLLEPAAQSFWWLFCEPPLYVVLVGLLFRVVVAPGLVEDLEDG
jgi:uncharacterized membrane protein